MIPDYDMHVHTIFSGHSHESATVARMSARASSLGMKLLCFTEHVYDAATLRDLEELRWQIGSFQRDCGCRLVVGGEFDADALKSDGSLTAEPPSWVEFVIGSVHYVPGTDIFPDEPLSAYNLDRQEILVKWRNTLLGLASNPRVDMIGHPGVLIGILLGSFPDEVLAVFREAALISAARGQFWDFNDLAFEKLPGLGSEYCRVLQTAVDAGVTLLYGSDSHSMLSLGRMSNVMNALTRINGLTPEKLLQLPEVLKRRFKLA